MTGIYQPILNLLREKVENPQTATEKDLNTCLDFFPFNQTVNGENLNYYLLKLIFKRPELVDKGKLSQKLRLDEEALKVLLKKEPIEVSFPIVEENNAKLVKALVVPLEGPNKIIFPDRALFKTPDIEEGLKTVQKLIGKGFLITFETTNFSGKSFTLAVYSALKYGRVAENLAYTGVVLEKGSIEPVEGLEEKLKAAKRANKPLIFPSEDLNNLTKLDRFLKELEIPLSVIFDKKKVETFENSLPFKGDYIKKVFHLEDINLHYLTEDGNLKETQEEFQKVKQWLEGVLNKISYKVVDYLKPFGSPKVALTQQILAISFISGILFSKKRLPVKFYNYDNTLQGYKEIYTIIDDKETYPDSILYEYFEIEEPKEGQIEEIHISFKGKPVVNNQALVIYRKPEKEIPNDITQKKLGNTVAKFLRNRKEKFSKLLPKLMLQSSNAFAFALGYYLEDYIPLKVMHKDITAFVIALPLPSEGKIFITETPEDFFNLLNTYYGEISYSLRDEEEFIKQLKETNLQVITNSVKIKKKFQQKEVDVEVINNLKGEEVKSIALLRGKQILLLHLTS